LRGDSTVSLFPTGSVSFSDVVLGEDGTRDPALSAERLTARLRLLPLFIGRIEIADVFLDRPRINMTFGPEGRSNWSGLMVSLARALGPKANRADQEASFSEIRVRGGIITLTDSVHRVSETLTGADLALAWPSISKSFAATGRVVWRGEPVDASISLSDFPSALAGERSGLKVRLNGNLLKFAFEGSMSVRPTLKVDGTLSADSTSLRDALRWAGQSRCRAVGLDVSRSRPRPASRAVRLRSRASISSSTAIRPKVCSHSPPTGDRRCKARSPRTISI
jgi:AsmA protein